MSFCLSNAIVSFTSVQKNIGKHLSVSETEIILLTFTFQHGSIF